MAVISKGKQRIINATVDVLKECPIDQVSMRKIALKAGVTTGSIYHHYKNKDELLFDVMKQTLHFTTRLYETVKNDNHKEGQALLEEINQEVKARLLKTEEQTLHIHFFSDVIKQKNIIKDEYQHNYKNMIESTAELFTKALNIRNDDYQKSMAAILVAAMDGIAMQQALDVLPEDLTKLTDVFIDFFNESIPQFLKNYKK